jgi:prephenate dehydrogenase
MYNKTEDIFTEKKMRIAVVGLGLIGASIARALKKADFAVDGWNRTKTVSDFALQNGYIDGIAEDFTAYNVVFVALPPKATIDFLTDTKFADGAIVADICGVKEPVERAVRAKKRNYRYVGTHPMAGKETSGIESSTEKLFVNANIILTENEETDREAKQTVYDLYKSMGAGKITVCDAVYHDREIAYTSQLAHIVSNAYIKSDAADSCSPFTGGSFQDMTRVAPLDEKIWTELFLMNREPLKDELSGLISRLQTYLSALEKEDKEELKSLLAAGKEKYFSAIKKKK